MCLYLFVHRRLLFSPVGQDHKKHLSGDRSMPALNRVPGRIFFFVDSETGISDTSSSMSFVKSEAVRSSENEEPLTWPKLSKWFI